MRTARRERSHAPAPVRVQLPQRPAWLEPPLVIDLLAGRAAGVRETCTKLATLSAMLSGGNTGDSRESTELESAPSRFHELRLYAVRDSDANAAATGLTSRSCGLERLEIAVADFGRDELLPEAEGVAVLDAPAPAA